LACKAKKPSGHRNKTVRLKKQANQIACFLPRSGKTLIIGLFFTKMMTKISLFSVLTKFFPPICSMNGDSVEKLNVKRLHIYVPYSIFV